MLFMLKVNSCKLYFEILDSCLLFWELDFKVLPDFIIIIKSFVEFFFDISINLLKIIIGDCESIDLICEIIGNRFDVCIDELTHFNFEGFQGFKIISLWFSELIFETSILMAELLDFSTIRSFQIGILFVNSLDLFFL